MQDKNSLRKELLARRDAIPPEVRKVKDRMILDRLESLEEFRDADRRFFFASFRSEVDTIGIIRRSLANGKKVILPKVDRARHMLLLYRVDDISELVPGYMGIPEPALITGTSEGGQAGLPVERLTGINEVDVIIIPGAGFDASGNRIGYGAGYYDKLLSGLQREVPIVAPAYEEQIAEAIPAEPHDRRVDIIVTDRRIIRSAAT